ncbi:MAG: hypothetical protein FWG12_04065 [Holophagaceae bacterium]|nr:hypothetical protein [Holophagaceae bacterium]
MAEKKKDIRMCSCGDPECECSCRTGGECACEESENEIEVVELEDDDGNVQDFAILEKLNFENRHFAVISPLSEVQALQSNEDDSEIDLSIEIFEVDGDNFMVLEDEALARRLMKHLDDMASKLE